MIDNKRVGLYIHVPFCRSKCPYCSFYSFIPKSGIIDEYCRKIKDDLKRFRYTYDTVYFGGGTPSVLGADRISDILSAINFENGSEITVECNPSDTGNKDRFFDFSILKNAGVNRISMGLQSAVENERKLLGRKAGKDEILTAIDRITKSGIDNYSLDLMLGIPGQKADSLDESLDFCLSAGAKHISCYILKIEEGTFFAKNREKYRFPDDDTCSDFYLQTSKKLTNAGMNHYEISNFAFPRYESRHNNKYWNCEEYLGLGPSAHSFIDGKRFYYPNIIEEYLKGCSTVSDGEGGDAEEYLMLRLRLSEGIKFKEFENKYGPVLSNEFHDKCRYFASKDLGLLTPDGFRLTPEGYLLSNRIIFELTELI